MGKDDIAGEVSCFFFDVWWGKCDINGLRLDPAALLHCTALYKFTTHYGTFVLLPHFLAYYLPFKNDFQLK
jgi:hypothetical protein